MTGENAWLKSIPIPAEAAIGAYQYQEIKRRVQDPSEYPDIPSYVPERWSHLIKRCWSFDPMERPSMSAVADELITDLDSFLVGDFEKADWNDIQDYIDLVKNQGK